MASTLTVDNIVGATSASKVMIPGHVVQVVFSTLSSNYSNSAGSFTSTGLSATITPSSSSNKIYVLLDGEGGQNTSGRSCFYRIMRDGATQLTINDNLQTGTTSSAMPLTATALDSPSTTSAITYTLEMRTDGAGTVSAAGSQRSRITLMEIAQ
jgi:hypothetical protein